MSMAQDTDPCTVPHAQAAERYAWAHVMSRLVWEKNRTPDAAQEIAYWQKVRETHHHSTGWLVEPLDGENLRYYYTDPSTRDQGGGTLTWTTGAEQ